MSVADRAIPYAAIRTVADMKALLTLAEAESKRPKDQQRFRTLIIDTVDAYQRIVIQEYLVANKKDMMSGWVDWGFLDAEMTELVARLSNLTMNVVVNLHVKPTKVGGSDDGDGGYLVQGPKLKGDFKDQIAAEFDLVGFMETGWEAVDGKRVLARYIQWEPSPDKPIAGDRSGQLLGKTPVTFTDEDYLGLLRPMQAYLDKMKAGSVIVEVETPAPVEPVAVAKGGPVGTVAKAATPAKAAPTKGAAKPAPAPLPEGAEDIEPTKLRQAIARRMSESKRNAPHFYVSVDIDAGKLLALLARINKAKAHVSVNDLLVKALALAAAKHTNVNAAYIDDKVRHFKRIDVGIAVATENGLLSPAILDCADKPVVKISQESKDLAERARSGHLKPEEYGGGTITLSNLGMYGITSFLAIINPPQALIVSVGRAADRVVVKAGKPAVGKVMTAWAAADHRVLDGAEVAQFMATFRELVEDPGRLSA